MRWLLCLLSGILLVALTACAKSAPVVDFGIDSGLLTEKPCKAPCWQDLTPGRSTSSDVDHFLNNLSRDKWPERSTSSYNSGCRLIQVSDKPGYQVDAVVYIYVENGKVSFIQSSHSRMPSLKQIVDHFGPPQYFEAIHAVGPDGEFYILEVYYPRQGLAFQVSTTTSDMGSIREDMLVDLIQYFSPSDMLSYFTTRYSCDLGQEAAQENAKDETLKKIQQWHGFGEVNVIQSK